MPNKRLSTIWTIGPDASGDTAENLVFGGILARCNDAIAFTSNTVNLI
jgi:hypothetical protein